MRTVTTTAEHELANSSTVDVNAPLCMLANGQLQSLLTSMFTSATQNMAEQPVSLNFTKYHDFVGLVEVSGKVVDHNSGKEIPGVEVTFRFLNEVATCTDTRDDDDDVSKYEFLPRSIC